MNFAQSGPHCTTSMMFVNVGCINLYSFPRWLLYFTRIWPLWPRVGGTCHDHVPFISYSQIDEVSTRCYHAHTYNQCLALVGIVHVLLSQIRRRFWTHITNFSPIIIIVWLGKIKKKCMLKKCVLKRETPYAPKFRLSQFNTLPKLHFFEITPLCMFSSSCR